MGGPETGGESLSVKDLVAAFEKGLLDNSEAVSGVINAKPYQRGDWEEINAQLFKLLRVGDDEIKAFQAKHGLEQDGKVGPKTIAKLNDFLGIEKVVMESGEAEKAFMASREEVLKIINASEDWRVVNPQLFALSGIDVAVVEAFQEANGLKVDGKVGPNTIGKLKEVMGAKTAAVSRKAARDDLSDEVAPVLMGERKEPVPAKPSPEPVRVKAKYEDVSRKRATEKKRSRLEIEKHPDFRKYEGIVKNIKNEKLKTAAVSDIPYTAPDEKLPPKGEGIIRVVAFGDTDYKALGRGGNGKNRLRSDDVAKKGEQVYLKELQAAIAGGEFGDVDWAMFVGDGIKGGAQNKSIDSALYQSRVEEAKKEFSRFSVPYALTVGNHDLNGPDGKGGYHYDDMKDNFRHHLEGKEYDDAGKDAYSFKLGNATFVVFNRGYGDITERQKRFFRRKCKEANGAVHWYNHVPPYQGAHGPGLRKSGKHELGGFDEIQQIARDELERRGHAFYIAGGHEHLSQVIGNFFNPGAMGANYWAITGSMKGHWRDLDSTLRGVPSVAIIDIEKSTGKMKALHFRSARSGFSQPLPETQHAIAWAAQR